MKLDSEDLRRCFRKHLLSGTTPDFELLLDLLDYVLNDIASNRQFEEWSGIPLLPLASGTIVPFAKQATFILASQDDQNLLPHFRNYYIHNRAVSKIEQKGFSPDDLSRLGLTGLTLAYVAQNIDAVLPQAWKHADFVEWNSSGTSANANGSSVNWNDISQSPILWLPEELLLLIMWNLDYRDLTRLSITCKVCCLLSVKYYSPIRRDCME